MASLGIFSDSELEVLKACLHAAAEGPFFPDWEFQTLFGVTREQVQAVLAKWPAVEGSEVVDLAVNNSLANLLGYPHGLDREWAAWIPATSAEVHRLLRKWRGDQPSGLE